MAGTSEGGRKAAAKLKAKDPNHYAKIGSIGGKNSFGGGFAIDDRTFLEKVLRKPKRAVTAGRLGGQVSRRKKV